MSLNIGDTLIRKFQHPMAFFTKTLLDLRELLKGQLSLFQKMALFFLHGHLMTQRNYLISRQLKAVLAKIFLKFKCSELHFD